MRKRPSAIITLLKSVSFFLLFSVSLFAQQKQSDLAKIAILEFEDRSGTGNFGYMPKSLARAIDSSLKKKFEYISADGQIPLQYAKLARLAKPELEKSDWQSIAAQSKTDILILGHFTFDAEQNQLLIEPFIFTELSDSLIVLPVTRNAVDDSLFGAVDRVADNIVAELTRIAQEQLTTKAGSLPESKPEEDKKMPINREDNTVHWKNKTITLELGAGMGVSLGEIADKTKEWMAGNFYAGYAVLPWLQLGIDAEYRLTKILPDSAKFNIMQSIVYGGYTFSANRWQFAAMAGAGYYFIDTDLTAINSKGNPAAAFRLASRYLLTTNFHLGLTTSAYAYYDEPSIFSTDAKLTLGFSF